MTNHTHHKDNLNNISIAKLREYRFDFVTAYRDKLIVSESISTLNMFKDPCRVDGMVIFVCLKGEVDCLVDLKRYHLTSGTMLINFTSSIIQVIDAKDMSALAALASYSYIDKLQVDIESKLSLYLGVKNCAIAQLPMSDVRAFDAIFGLMRKTMTDKREDSDATLDAMVAVLARMVISAMKVFGEVKEISHGSKHMSRSEEIFENFMSLLSLRRAHERNLNYYATEMGITPNYLSLVVRNVSGKSAAEWINEYTINEAKVLLRFSEMSVQHIAENLGFPSQSSFGKFFKQYVGVSPSNFRKREEREDGNEV